MQRQPIVSLRSGANRRALASAACVAALVVACGGGDSENTPATVAQRESVSAAAAATATAAPSASSWSSLIPISLVPVAAGHLPNGKILLWSALGQFSFSTTGGGQTYTSLFDPATLSATERLVNETGHEMFCPGTSNLPDGRLLINGGSDSAKTSIYTASTATWATAATMNIPRGYEGNTVLQDGSVLTLGGSWSGGQGGKNAEVWTAASGWRLLSGVPVDPALAVDPQGIYRADNHMWLFTTPDGRVLQAGPSPQMNWIDTQGNGSISSAGTRGNDAYSQNGNAVMYDVGKILKVGGAPAYENIAATAHSYVIDINAGVSVHQVASMAYARAFSSAVVLPDGKVLVIGGQTFAKLFSDDNSVLVPELWDPATETFTPLPPIAVGRNYHSVALLLPDARVLSGGGGLCGSTCAANHPDLQVLTPYYLLNADGSAATRPVLASAPATATHGTTISVQADSVIASFALVRMSSTTHAVNTDQRRIPVPSSETNATNHTYALTLPSNPGVILPGYYMLFALNGNGVPSVAKLIQITGNSAPKLTSPGPQTSVAGSPVSLTITATSANGSIVYSATALPPGLSINSSTGVISGTPTTAGNYTATVTATNSVASSSTNVLWTVSGGGGGGSLSAQYVKLEALSEIHGKPWSAMAEFNLLDGSGAVMSRSGWVVSADSAETQKVDNSPPKAIDGYPLTYWHTQWYAASPPLPHWYVANLGSVRTISGFKYLPPPASDSNGTIGDWRFYTSSDGVNWTLVKQGTFAPDASEKTVALGSVSANQPPTLAAVANQSTTVGQSVSLALSGSDPDGDPLSYSATGLPPGLSINASTGVIGGSPTTAGTYNVTAQVSDGRGGTASRSFVWTVSGGGGGGSLSAQYVKLEALSEIHGKPWSAMAEFNLLDGSGAVMSRSGWVVSADSAETQKVNNSPPKAIDGYPLTYWHTQWYAASPPLPHWYVANLGSVRTISGFKYLPPPASDSNGTIGDWRFYTSSDGVNWTLMKQGTFAPDASEKTVSLP